LLRPEHRQRGVSLIELMIGLGIVAVLFAAGAPSFKSWVQSNQIRNATEEIQAGLNLARAEAVRRNTAVSFILGAGSAWTVGCASPVADLDGDGAADCPATIQARPAPASVNTVIQTSELVAVTNAAATTPVFTSTLAFNGVGRVGAGLPAGNKAVFNISNPTGGACASAGPMRCMRVVVSSGGQIRMCDPALASADPQGC
jgi:type IV fimbrial biogenesis protein FimT